MTRRFVEPLPFALGGILMLGSAPAFGPDQADTVQAGLLAPYLPMSRKALPYRLAFENHIKD